jgi:hypothetical protein
MIAGSIPQLAICVVMIAAVVALVYIALRKFGVAIPDWVVQVFWVLVVAFVIIAAIRVVSSM